MLELYTDQTDLMQRTRQAMNRHKAVLIQAATGSGKTALATYMGIRTLEKKKKFIFSVPRIGLMEQTSETFTKYGINHSFIASGKDYNPFADVFIGMTETMARRRDKLPKVHMTIFDETHHGADALGEIIAAAKEPWIDHDGKTVDPWALGLSATPTKLNGQGLGIWYNEMVCGLSIRELINLKRLCDYRYFFGRKTGEFDQLRQRSEKEISEYMEEKKEIIGDCVRDYKLRCMGNIHLVRCTSIKHSQLTTQAFLSAGIAAAHVDGKTKGDLLRQIYTAFAKREMLVICFADLLNFGFDLAQVTGIDACVESGSDQKPSESLAGQMQWWGRMFRMKPKPAVINDHVNNYLKHGLPCSDRIWTLDSKKKRTGGEKTPPTRQCPICWCVHPPAPKCANPVCGHIYEVGEGRIISEVEGTLEELNIEEERRKKAEKQEVYDAKSLEDLIRLGIKRNYKPQWAMKVFAARQNKTYNNLHTTED